MKNILGFIKLGKFLKVNNKKEMNITGLLLVVLLLVVAFVSFNGLSLFSSKGDINKVAEDALSFINENILLEEGVMASLVEKVEESGLYRLKLKIGEDEFDSYITKDGEILFPQFIKIKEDPEEELLAGIEKTDRPDVRLFVMSYCPYGLQVQKAFLPVYDLLKGKADMGVYFVNYVMHDKIEIDENLKQYCIQKEEQEKYFDYLSCFVQDGDSEECFESANIDRTKIADCVLNTDEQYKITEQYNDKKTWINEKYPTFNVHSNLNEEYGVGGSPTVVINGKIINIDPRSPEKFKQIICQHFSTVPVECSQDLSQEVPTPMFGAGTGGSSEGECK